VVVGIDVHKHSHVAALLDERGGEIGTLAFANSPQGMRGCRRGSSSTVPAKPSSASKARPVTAGSSSTRSRGQATRCSTSRPGARTASGIATVRAKRTLVTRSRSTRWCCANGQISDRRSSPSSCARWRFWSCSGVASSPTAPQAIQRLRADWNQVDPVGEAHVVNLTRQRELRRLKRISFGDGLVEQVAARCIRDLACDIEDLNQRIAALDTEIAQLLTQSATPSLTSTAPDPRSRRR
jgi:hypothetical protein